MNPLLERVFAEAAQLPEEVQGSLAQRFMAEIAGQKQWDELFADPRSPHLLEQLAKEAMGEIERGETVDLDAYLEQNNEIQNY